MANSIAKLLDSFFDNKMEDFETAFPAAIESVNDDGTVNVRPSVRNCLRNMQMEPNMKDGKLMVIKNVPVLWAGTKTVHIEYELDKGDTVLCRRHRSLHQLQQGHSQLEEGEVGRNSLRPGELFGKRPAQPSSNSVQARPRKRGDGRKHRPRRKRNRQGEQSGAGCRECQDYGQAGRGRGYFKRGKHRERRTDRSQRQGKRLGFCHTYTFVPGPYAPYRRNRLTHAAERLYASKPIVLYQKFYTYFWPKINFSIILFIYLSTASRS